MPKYNINQQNTHTHIQATKKYRTEKKTDLGAIYAMQPGNDQD